MKSISDAWSIILRETPSWLECKTAGFVKGNGLIVYRWQSCVVV